MQIKNLHSLIRASCFSYWYDTDERTFSPKRFEHNSDVRFFFLFLQAFMFSLGRQHFHCHHFTIGLGCGNMFATCPNAFCIHFTTWFVDLLLHSSHWAYFDTVVVVDPRQPRDGGRKPICFALHCLLLPYRSRNSFQMRAKKRHDKSFPLSSLMCVCKLWCTPLFAVFLPSPHFASVRLAFIFFPSGFLPFAARSFSKCHQLSSGKPRYTATGWTFDLMLAQS